MRTIRKLSESLIYMGAHDAFKWCREVDHWCPSEWCCSLQRQRHWFVNMTKPLFLKPSRYRCRNILSAKSQRVTGLNCYHFSYWSIFFFCPSLPIGSLYGTKIIFTIAHLYVTASVISGNLENCMKEKLFWMWTGVRWRFCALIALEIWNPVSFSFTYVYSCMYINSYVTFIRKLLHGTLTQTYT